MDYNNKWIIAYIMFNLVIPVYLLMVGSFKKKWQVVFCIIVPGGSIIYTAAVVLRNIKRKFNKLL